MLQVSSCMKDQSLQMVNDKNLVGVGQFLMSFITGQHKEKLSCIESFINCQDVVQWLRVVTKGNLGLMSKIH